MIWETSLPRDVYKRQASHAYNLSNPIFLRARCKEFHVWCEFHLVANVEIVIGHGLSLIHICDGHALVLLLHLAAQGDGLGGDGCGEDTALFDDHLAVGAVSYTHRCV